MPRTSHTTPRDLLERWPAVYLRLARMRHGDRVLGPGTELVIEGFPRSANTFAVTAFEMAQPAPVAVAHHLHSAGHVTAAVHRGVPALLLVRAPADAVVSSVMRKPSLDLAAVAGRYETFHRPLLPLLDHIEVAGFDQVTTDFGAVIDRVNARFGTRFARFQHTPENAAAVFARIDALSHRRTGSLDATVVARPDAAKEEHAAGLREAYTALPEATRARLDDLYAALGSSLTGTPHRQDN